MMTNRYTATVPEPAGPDPADEARLRRRGVVVVVLFFLLDAVMRSGYFHFGALTQGGSPPVIRALLAELTGSAATVVVFFAIVVPMCRRFPLRGPGWLGRVPAHLAAVLVFSVVKTLLMWGARAPLWPLFGIGTYDFGALEYRFLMEGANDVTSYGLLAAVVHAFDAWRERREREVRRAQREAHLSEAWLRALQAQLQPHFLFNTLNTISSVLYDDPRRADDLISRLSDLLRASLDAPDRPEVSLEEELEILRHYTDLMEARFGDRLSVQVQVDDNARGARVPIFLLQPLVENAIQYAVAPSARQGEVRVRVRRHDAGLRIEVDDDGPGIAGEPESVVGRGVGLRNMRDRLSHLHGPRATLSLENRPDGGLRVIVTLPWQPALASAQGGAGHV
ncbi:MAG TPA: histidine kinase [Longimicrobiales bacterium]|nr:histidine kinase [Longimicrobiales bacterium]